MKFVLITFLFVSAFARRIPDFRKCDSPSGDIVSVDISPCPSIPNLSGSCQLKHNTTVTISVDFTTKVNTTAVKTVVHGMVPSSFINIILSLVSLDGEQGLKFDEVEPDACKSSNVDHCNIIAGEKLTYTNALYVKQIYPEARLTVKWEIRDEYGQDMVCLLIPAEIVN